jgi:CRISPR/Cas system-associated protein Cas10 (large subunit of type III CRISPR-Cas system)
MTSKTYHENKRKEKAKEVGINLDTLESVFENGRTLYKSTCTVCGIDTGLKRLKVLLNKDHLCKSCNGKSHLGKIVSEETKTLLRLNNYKTNGRSHPFLGKRHSVQTQQVLSERQAKYCREHGNQFKGKTHSQETKVIISNKNSGVPPKWKGRTFEYNGPNGRFKMRSSYELLYATFLDENNVKWKYEPRFKLNDGRIFSPDFELLESGTIVEVKGYWTAKGIEKWNIFCKDYSDLPKVIIDKHDLIGLGLEISR